MNINSEKSWLFSSFFVHFFQAEAFKEERRLKMERKTEFPIQRERFNGLVKRAKRRALLKNVVVSLGTSLFFHWMIHRKFL